MPMQKPLQHSLRSTMRGTHLETGSTMLSRNNLQRCTATQPAPIRRSDSARIETWRDEVVSCCGGKSSSSSSSPPSTGSSASSSNFNSEPPLRAANVVLPSRTKEKEGRLSRVTSKFKRRSTGPAVESLLSAEIARTGMYDGNRPGERMMEHWEEGAGESLYFGSNGLSEGGRLDRAEQLLLEERGKGDKKI